MGYVTLFSATVALVLTGLLWRNSGETLTFILPTSMDVIVGEFQTSRKISFHRHWPVLGWHSPREIEPFLQAGTIIQVDLSSPEITEWGWSDDGKAFRVTQRVNEKTSHTYFLNTDKIVKGSKRVTLRIKSHNNVPSDAIHQEDWYWVREFYDCEVVNIS